MQLNLFQAITSLLTRWDFTPFWSDTLARIIIGGSVILTAWLVWLLTVKIVYRILERIGGRTRAKWDDELLDRRIFQSLAWLAPAVVVRHLAPKFLGVRDTLLNPVVVADMVMIASITLALVRLLGFINDLYNRRKEAKRRPIKGIVQAVQVILIAAAFIVTLSYLTQKPISGLLAGLGAISAVLMLVFKDPLMGLVAGFQISSNDMVRIGDWIEVPTHGADGDVIDISLLNVTIRNWDKTYATLPIQALTTGAFKNWRGMNESGGRRIKRSLSIDLSSIRFLQPEEIHRLGSVVLLADYLQKRSEEIRRHNETNGADRSSSPINGRALTNIGVFRTYVLAYLRAHPKVRPDMTLLVRQLQSGPEGLPLEVYLFTGDTAWERYEDTQSDIFDHLFAALGEFGLRAFQSPSGADFGRLSQEVV